MMIRDTMYQRPRLRPLDFQPVSHQGQQMWLLRDPLRLSDEQLVVPAPLAHMLTWMDGSHNIDQIHLMVNRLFNEPVDLTVVTDAVSALDKVYLLENDRFIEARHRSLQAYRSLPCRPPALAGLGYPDDPDELRSYLATFTVDNTESTPAWRARGVISPHIDYPRGGDVYATVWRKASQAVREADLILIFGTDHNGGEVITLTHQPYMTPFGVLPTDSTLVEKLAQALGEEEAFATELHHRDEHSIELSAVWLHDALGDQPPPVVLPVLCGSFQGFVGNGHHPDDDETIGRFHEVLRRESAGRRFVAVASVDFAHMGPAFGDEFAMDMGRRQTLKQQDDSLIDAIAQGDRTRFFNEIAAVQDQNRICGFSPIYHLLRFLGETEGVALAYQHCPADEENDSLVSIAGLLLS